MGSGRKEMERGRERRGMRGEGKGREAWPGPSLT